MWNKIFALDQLFHRAYNFDNNPYDWFQFWIEKPENSILVFNFVIFIVFLSFVKKVLFNLSRDFKIITF